MIKESFEELGCSKINIGLAITGKRDDGYHNIDTIFQSIQLGDSIYFTPHHTVYFSGGAPELPEYMQQSIPYDESNLALKALRAVQKYTGCKSGGGIHLLKRVPSAAGLGGGSADAAIMLKGLNRFWELQLTKEEMFNLAKGLGADVPFFLEGGVARGTGIGEVLEPLPSLPAEWLLVVRPNINISTAKAYAKFSGTSKADSKMIDMVIGHLSQGQMKNAFDIAENTFEELLFSEEPELVECKKFFEDRGYSVLMSGSGPTMVVFLDRALDAISLQEEVKKSGKDWLTLITKTCPSLT